MSPHTPSPTEVVLSPDVGATGAQLREVWQHRELIYMLAWREIKVRYRQTVIGAAWAVVQPIAMMAVFTVVFGLLVPIPTDGIPRPLFFYCGLTVWHYFTSAVSNSINVLVVNHSLIKKVFFPRLILPLANILAGLVDLSVTIALLIGMTLLYRFPLRASMLLVPAFIAALVLITLTLGIWGSALNVVYRDVRYGITLVLQVVMFLSPVAYPTSRIPEDWRSLYRLNPMAGVIEGFRWSVTGVGQPPGFEFAISMGVVLILLAIGLRRFWRAESTFADVI